ncbi:relaxase/mobilization nuclease domain-containing protein [Parafilimonas sp.]|uniref:relaxase/mobilization nuclease domain-containing protein n=1 Tax=Parafilimonas sp. TaxID=1969739 RepID=UPI003F80A11E
MVAKITTPKRLVAALNYNEHKVSQNKAECLYAGNFLKVAKDMNFYQKMEGFERLNVLNERAQTKTLHISLNFDPSEKLSADKLVNIANSYMDKIGFGEQPFLIYKHNDAGHPHVHIVTTTIRDDGSRINTHNIGRNQSEKARKEIEREFKLIYAENQKQFLKQKIQPVNAEKIIYGKVETKRAIANVVNAVLHTYKYASLPEFNAILKQYNVIADRGKEESRIYKNHGLVYRVLDKEGQKIGVPVKASSVNSQPTLNKLEKLFIANKDKKESLKQHTKSLLNQALSKKPAALNELISLLESKKIATVLRQNAAGRIYGITFVDNQNKVVFNGSDLGRQYSIAHLQNIILTTNNVNVGAGEKQLHLNTLPRQSGLYEKNVSKALNETPVITTRLLDELLTAKQQGEFMPYQLIKKKRRKKKKHLGL